MTNQSFNSTLDTDMLKEDLRSEIALEFAKMINTYKSEFKTPFGAYAAQNLPLRLGKGGIFDRLIETKINPETGEREIISKQDITEKQIEGETVEQTQVLNKTITKIKTKLGLKESTISKIRGAVRKVFGTKLPAVTAKNFKRKLTDSFKNELTDLVKNYEIFGKDKTEYKSLIIKNAEAIYNSLPLEVMTKSFKNSKV